MRAAVVLVCLLFSGCSVLGIGRDRDGAEDEGEVVEAPRKQEPREKPSDVLKPPRRKLASPTTDYFYVRAGYFAASAATAFRLDGDPVGGQPGPQGTLLSAEEDLGLNDSPDQGRLEFSMRIKERNRVRVDFLQVDRDNIQQINRDITFGNQTFLVNERVQSLLDFRMISLTYTYSPLKFDRFELGVGIGAHALVAEARGRVQARNIREEETGAAGFATIALDLAWRMTDRFAVTARGQYFSANVEETDGSLGDYHVDLQYRFRPNLAFGIGYSSTQIDILSQQSSFPGLFNLEVDGPEAFFRVSF
jgi:hypothetical protein